ncbi:MAG TPA: four helix bundle protein [Bacillota bacterium]
MESNEKFEDTEAWGKARELAKIIYQATALGQLPQDRVLQEELRRVTLAVMVHIARSFESVDEKEYFNSITLTAQFITELKTQLYVAKDIDLLTESQFEQLYVLAMEIRQALKNIRKPGNIPNRPVGDYAPDYESRIRSFLK